MYHPKYICLQASHIPVPCSRTVGREVLLLVEKGWAKDRLGTLNMRQFIGQDEVLAGVMERVISVILERL